MGNKAIVLSSGGVDSTTCVGFAIDHLGAENVATVSFKYGQKHDKELVCAEKVAQHYNVPHYVIDLSEVMKYSNCSLLRQSDKAIPEGTYAEQIDRTPDGMVSTYVPSYTSELMLMMLLVMPMQIAAKNSQNTCRLLLQLVLMEKSRSERRLYL